MEKVSGPLGPRRRIATTLKRLREDSGQNLTDVARELMISTSKLSRLENAQGKPRPRDIRDLIRYYRIEGTQEAARLNRWVTSAQMPGWWTDFDDDVLDQLDAHLAYEADAAVARTYTLPFLPALLQTEEYAEAVFRDMEQRPAGKIRQLMDIRKTRQEALISREGLKPLQLVAVTHEATLHQMVGSPGNSARPAGRDPGTAGPGGRRTAGQHPPARTAVLGPAGPHYDVYVRLFRISGPRGSGAGRRQHRDARRVLEHRGP